MKKLLYVKGSPRTNRSRSMGAAEAFLTEYCKSNHDVKVEVLDLWQEDLPEFTETAATARYKVSQEIEMSEAETEAWGKVRAFAENFKQYDEYLFAVPMWNFSLPYRVKYFIDIVTQPNLTFEVTDVGYKGLLENKKAYVVFSSHGAYDAPELAALDHCRPYFRLFLGFIGITDISEINLQGAEDQSDQIKAEIERILSA